VPNENPAGKDKRKLEKADTEAFHPSAGGSAAHPDAVTRPLRAGSEPAATPTLTETQVASARTVASESTTEHVSSGAAAHEGFSEGTKIDRFVVLDKLGEGGMGIVLAAYDPLLDRKVALKLLRPHVHHGAARAMQRLLREARAMAKLSHPNVVTVHDVGTVEGHVYIAMEFVDGETLGQWAKRERRSAKEVLEVYLMAARGLAAAHQAGLVHRDFKPQNCLIGTDGRVRVTDFGLVSPPTPDDASLESMQDRGSPAADEATPSPSLTHTGEVMGTPGYMAPEQHAGEATDARADQFSFCVALYEALYAAPPFGGDTYAEIARRVTEGERAPIPEGKHVPARVERALGRGLATDRDQRFASMDALIAVLAYDRAASRRRLAVAAAAVAAVAAATIYVQVRSAGDQACVLDADRFADVWAQPERARLRAAFHATGRADASPIFERVAAGLDRYVRSWKNAWQQTCEASARKEQSGDALDLRMRCLERRRAALGTLVAVLTSEASPETLSEAVTAASALPGFDRCADLEALRAVYPPPEDPELRDQIAALETRADEVEALERIGKYDQGLERSDGLLSRARELDYPPLLARALLARGTLLQRTGSLDESEKSTRSAVSAAVAARDPELEARAWIWLVWNLNAQARYDAAVEAGEAARSAIERAGNSELLQARLENRLGLVARQRGDLEAAVAHLERAQTLFESAGGPDEPDAAFALANLGFTAVSSGDYPGAKAYFERALARLERILGPTHPHVAAVLQGLAVIAKVQGDYAEAMEHLQRTMEIRVSTLGEDHAQIADTANTMGNVASLQGDYAAAKAYYQRALDTYEKALGPEHPRVAVALYGLASVAKEVNAYDEARRDFERALALEEKAKGPDHPDVATTLHSLALVQRELGDCRAAMPLLQRAQAIQEKSRGPEHPSVAAPLTAAGACLIELGTPAKAVPLLERAVHIREQNKDKVIAKEIAESQYTLARALWAANRDRERARSLAGAARATFVAGGKGTERSLSEIDRWMTERGLR